MTTEGATRDGATTVGAVTVTRGAVREARSGTLTGGAAERRSRRAEWVRERAVAPDALVDVGVTVSPGDCTGAGTDMPPDGWSTTLPSWASESCTLCCGDTATVCGDLLTTTWTFSVTGAGVTGTSTEMVPSWLDVGEGGGVDSGMIPCSFSSSARLTVGALTGFSTGAGADVVAGCG